MSHFIKHTLGAAVGCALLGGLAGPMARATDLLIDPADTVGSTSSNQSQLGRVSRNGTAQSWIGTETAYPGSTGAANTYFSKIFTFTPAQLGNGAYVELTLEDTAANVFVSAWTGGYNLTAAGGALSTNPNFLGDNGTSRDYAFGAIPPTPQDPRYFQVVVPAGGNLVVVVTDTVAGGALQNFGLTVANYTDTQYTDAVPEPSTWALLGAGAAAGAGVWLRRRRATV